MKTPKHSHKLCKSGRRLETRKTHFVHASQTIEAVVPNDWHSSLIHVDVQGGRNNPGKQTKSISEWAEWERPRSSNRNHADLCKHDRGSGKFLELYSYRFHIATGRLV